MQTDRCRRERQALSGGVKMRQRRKFKRLKKASHGLALIKSENGGKGGGWSLYNALKKGEADHLATRKRSYVEPTQ